jgi:hypothetical protein
MSREDRHTHSKAAIDFAFDELERSGGTPSSLSVPVRAVIVIVSAQGVIDNGGLQYFFESDFPNHPSYDTFIEAYREIGATSAARVIAQAVALFPFPEPNKSAKLRNEFMDSFCDEDGDPIDSPFTPLSKEICGSSEVWDRLESYVIANSDAFKAAPGVGEFPG